MEIILPYIIQLAAGAAGGIVAGIVFKSLSLGPVGNALAGVAGAGISGQILLMLGGGGLLEGVAGQLVSGGVGGAALMVAVGLLKKAMNEQAKD